MSNWAAIAMLAIAFQLVYLPTGVFFLALAGVYAATPYVVLGLVGVVDPWVAGVSAVSLGALVAYLCDRWSHTRLTRRRASHGVHLIASLGVYIVIVQLVAIGFGNEVRVLKGGEQLIVDWQDLKVRLSQGIVFATGVVVCAVYLGALRWTDAGLRMRALADDPQQFELFGRTPTTIRAGVVAAAGGLTALTATLSAYDQGFDPHGGLHVLLIAIVAVIIGGRGSFIGPLIGAFVVAVVRETTAWTWSAHWREFATFLVLCVFLVFLPRGIVAGSTRAESEAR